MLDPRKTESLTASGAKCDVNRDPMAGTPGAHPVGVGTGALGGGVAGAVVGAAVGGPIGATLGAFAGAVAGGMAGKGAAEAINPTAEHEFWRAEFIKRPYFAANTPYDQYGPAYQFGWESFAAHTAKTFKDAETQLARDWDSRRGTSKLTWNNVRGAARDAWKRVEEAAHGKKSCD